MSEEYRRGLSDALAIAEAEEANWHRRAKKHADSYWGGWNSEYAQRDLKMAKIARSIADAISSKLQVSA